MATRIYLPASGTAPLASLAYDANWEQSANAVRLPCGITKGNTALTNKSGNWPSASTQQWVWCQFQSAPMSAGYSWTTADTISMVIRCQEVNTSCDSHLAYSVRVVSEDGSTVRGTIGLYHATSTEFGTSALTRIHNARTTGSTNFTSYSGDRIIIEIGLHGVTPSTAYSNTIRIGDPSATSDFALTAGLNTDLCPWVELSHDVIFGNARMVGQTDGVALNSGTLVPPTGSTEYISGSIGGAFSVTDDFESYSTGDLPGQGNWLNCTWNNNTGIAIVDTSGDNRYRSAVTGSENGAMRSETFSDNQFSQAVIDVIASEVGVGIRMSMDGTSNAFIGYQAIGPTPGGIKTLYFVINNSWTSIAEGTPGADAGDTIRIEVLNNVVTCYLNGSVDTTLGIGGNGGSGNNGVYDISTLITNQPRLAHGSVGITSYYASGTYGDGDDFSGGNLGVSLCGATVTGNLQGKAELCNQVLGTQHISNSTFDTDVSGWVTDTGDLPIDGYSWVDGRLYQNGTVSFRVLEPNGIGLVLAAGLKFRFKFDMDYISGSLRITRPASAIILNASGHYIFSYVDSGSGYFFMDWGGWSGYLDNAYFWTVTGAHGSGVATVSGTLSEAVPVTTLIGSSIGVSTVAGYLNSSTDLGHISALIPCGASVSGTMLAKALISGSSVGSCGGGQYDLLTGLTAHWSFDETSGVYEDSIGENDSVAIGSGITRGQTGRIGNAAQFDGTGNAYVLLPDSSDLQFESSDVTFGCWFYTDGDYGQTGLFGGEDGSFAMDTYENRHLFLGNTLNAAYNFDNLTYNLNSWNFAVIVFNSSLTTNNATLYLNGNTQTITANFNGFTGASTRIIGMDYLYGLPFRGLMDSPFIYKGRLLSEAELTYLYNSGNGRPLSEFASGGISGTLSEGEPAITLIGSSVGVATISGTLVPLEGSISGQSNVESSVSGILQGKVYISGSVGFQSIIADHTVVDKFDDIPTAYMDEVKKMWISYAGESHSEGIRIGAADLETAYPSYDVAIQDSGTPEAYTDQHLRISRATWGDVNNASGWIYDYGEEDWYTSSTAISRTKASLQYCKDTGPALGAFGFGWCWDPAEVDMATYLDATQQFIDYCIANSISTKVFFTTGPVDDSNASGETGYNKSLAYEEIRSYVRANRSRILFDYADILCYNNDGSGPNTATWDGHTYPVITTESLGDATQAHIGSAGCLRLAKALWWMLARMSGWGGDTFQSTVSGTLTVASATENISGSTNGIPSVSGTLLAKGQLTGAISTSSTVSGEMSGLGLVAGSSGGVASVSALLLGQSLFSGTATGNTNVAGTLAGRGVLQGETTSTASVTGIIYGTCQLDGAVAGLSVVSGVLLAKGKLSGTTDGVANLTSSLRALSSGSLTGYISSATVVTGNLTANDLLGTSVGVTSVEGVLTARGGMLGQCAGGSSISGIVIYFGRFVASASASSQVTGILVGVGTIQGLSEGVSNVVGALPAIGPLVGGVNGTSNLTASLRGLSPGFLIGSINGGTIVSGHLTANDLLGTSSGTAIVSASLLGKVSIVGTINGTTIVNGVGKVRSGGVGAGNGDSIVSGSLQGKGSLIGTINGTTIILGTFTSEGSLIGISDGVSSVSGVLYGIGVLHALTEGITLLDSTLGGIADLSGQSVGVSDLTSTLLGTGALFGGTDGVAESTARVSTEGQMVGVIGGRASLFAVLEGIGKLKGDVIGEVHITGEGYVYIALEKISGSSPITYTLEEVSSITPTFTLTSRIHSLTTAWSSIIKDSNE